MSLNRLALRLATVAALTNNGAEPWPTMAGARVFDSRIEPVEDLAAKAAWPLAVVYTDHDVDAPASAATNTRERRLTLTIELMLAVARELEAGDDYEVGVPATDDELETALDVFEAQVHGVLAGTGAAAQAWQGLVHRVHGVNSRRGATTEGGQRLAARQIVIEAAVLRDAIRGTLPPALDRLCALLDGNPALAARAGLIRGLATGAAGTERWTQDIAALGLTAETAAALGLDLDGAVRIPAELRFEVDEDPHGAPP